MVKKEKLKKIILGTWPISGDYSKANDEESIKMLKYAYRSGILEFDTAPNYGFGRSESLIGRSFKNFKNKPKINTKIGNNHNKKKSFNLSIIKKTFENSLKMLMISKVNILYLHNPRNLKNQTKILNYLKSLKNKKKINNYGLSISKDYKYDSKFIEKFKIIQLDYNILYLKNYFYKYFKNKVIHARSPFAAGTIFLLNNKKKFSKNDFRKKWVTIKRKRIIMNQLETIKKKYKKDIYNLSLNFLFNDSFANKIIFGVKNKSQLISLIKQTQKINRNYIDVKNYKKFYLSNNLFKEKGF